MPGVGARTAGQLEESLQNLDTIIPREVLDELDQVSAIERGFPHDFLASDNVKDLVFGGVYRDFIW